MSNRLLARGRRRQWFSAAQLAKHYRDLHLEVDYPKREVSVDGNLKPLTPIEYALVSVFVQNAGNALSLEYLLTQVWGGYGTTELIKWHISNLRKKLCSKNYTEDSWGIVTVRGYGYRYDSQRVMWE